ncbi:MAG: lipase family protein [Clostridia bacterium]|nr:lipase family protein [Clostridia bacterium]
MNFGKLLHYLNYTDRSYYDVYIPSKTAIKTEYVNNKKTDIQYILRVYENSILIAFRGTDSVRDMISNMQFFKKTVCNMPGGRKIRIHSGFFKAYTDAKIFDKIVKYITDKTKRIEITGHSYGGALALICAADLAHRFPDIEYEVVVFGSPRTGNKAFAEFFDAYLPGTFRIENGNDIITKLPPPVFGYRHVGKTYRIGSPRIPFFYSFKEHSLCSYRQKIFK